MESQAFKAFVAIIGIFVVGFAIIATTRESPQEKIQGAFLQTSSLLSSLAMEKCAEAVKKETGATAYTPNESNSDHMTYVHMIWKNIGSAAQAECRYVMDQGITLLKIDDRTVIAKDIGQTAPASAPKPVHH